MDIPKSTYIYTNVNYTLEQILAFYNAKRIDTDLDCQRGYVWQESQKQQLIDTLINRERIPEFHVIKEADEAIFHFADGKQRITTIIKFLTDELKWNKADANPIYHMLFDKKNKLKFSELPENFQNMILNTQISFALYSNMNPALVTKLFRKLNNGTALTEFQKGLAENITVKNSNGLNHDIGFKNFIISWMNYCINNNIPVLGICMGHQIIGLYSIGSENEDDLIININCVNAAIILHFIYLIQPTFILLQIIAGMSVKVGVEIFFAAFQTPLNNKHTLCRVHKLKAAKICVAVCSCLKILFKINITRIKVIHLNPALYGIKGAVCRNNIMAPV